MTDRDCQRDGATFQDTAKRPLRPVSDRELCLSRFSTVLVHVFEGVCPSRFLLVTFSTTSLWRFSWSACPCLLMSLSVTVLAGHFFHVAKLICVTVLNGAFSMSLKVSVRHGSYWSLLPRQACGASLGRLAHVS